MPLPRHCADDQVEYPVSMQMGISRENYISALEHILAEFDKAWTGKDVDVVHKRVKSKLRQMIRRKFWAMVGRPDLINYIFMNIGVAFEELLKRNLPSGESAEDFINEFNMESLMVQKGGHIPAWFNQGGGFAAIAPRSPPPAFSPTVAPDAAAFPPDASSWVPTSPQLPVDAEADDLVSSWVPTSPQNPASQEPSPATERTLSKLRRFATRNCNRHFSNEDAIQKIVQCFMDQAAKILEWGSELSPKDLADSMCGSFIDAVAHAGMEPISELKDIRFDLKRIFAPRKAASVRAISEAAVQVANPVRDDVFVMGVSHPLNTQAAKAFVMELGQDLKRFWTAEGGPDHLGGIYYRATARELGFVQALIEESNTPGGVAYNVVNLMRIQNPNTLKRMDAFKMLHPTNDVLLSFHSTGDASNFNITKVGETLTHELPTEGTPVHDMAMNGVAPHCLKRVAGVFGPGFYVARRSRFVQNSQYRTCCKSDPSVHRFFVVLGLPGAMKDVTSIDKSKASDVETSFRVVDSLDSYNRSIFMYCTQFVSIQTYMAYVVDVAPKLHSIVPLEDV